MTKRDKKLLNFSTIIEPEQTIAEIQQELVAHGATAMLTEYDGRQVSAVSFKLDVGGKAMSFKLPCNWRAVRAVFDEQGITYVVHKDKDLDNQAIRTAWRVILVWVKSQLALVEINMTTVPQVFLSYAVTGDGRTLSEKIIDEPDFLLGSGEK